MPGKNFNIDLVLGAFLTANFSKTMSSAQSKIVALETSVKKLRSEFKDIFANPDLSGLEKLKLGGLNKIQQGLAQMQAGGTKLSSAGSNAMGLYYQTRMYGRMFENSAKAAMSYETALAGVKKVVKFDNAQQFTDMSNAILSMTHTIPMTAEGIARIVASGGQAGIAREELLGFAEGAAKMGVAFNVTAEEAGDMMAAWRTAFKMGQSDVNTLADKINYLGNTTAALPTQIADVVTRIGPLGKVGGIASGEIAALGASAVAAGIQSEIAATGIKKLITALTSGKDGNKAFKALGLDAAKVAQAMQVDARGTILDVLDRLSKMDATRQVAAMNALFGERGIMALAPLLSNLDALKANFDKVANVENYASGVNDAFARRTATTQNSIQLMDNSLKSVSVTAGQSLLPALNDVVRKVAEMGSGFQKFAAENPETTKALIKGSMGLFGIVTGAKLATISWTALSGAWNMAAGAVTALGGAMMAHPVLAAITAVTLGGYALYKNWDTVKEKFGAAWDWMKSKAAAFMDWFAEKCKWIGEKWQALKDMLPDFSVSSVNPQSAEGLAMLNPIGGYATGGRFTRPTLSLIGEGDSPEYVIPVQGKYKSNGLALWAAAGRDLGVPMFAGGGAVGSGAERSRTMANADLLAAMRAHGEQNKIPWLSTPVSENLNLGSVFKSFVSGYGAADAVIGSLRFLGAPLGGIVSALPFIAGTLSAFFTLWQGRTEKLPGTLENFSQKELLRRSVAPSQDKSGARTPQITNYYSFNINVEGESGVVNLKSSLETLCREILEKIQNEQKRLYFNSAVSLI